MAGQYNSLVDALTDLRRRGYTYDFNLKPDCIECEGDAIRLYPQDFTIDEVYRLEGDSSSAEESAVIFAISGKGIKGVLIDAYGAYSELLNSDLAAKLSYHSKE